MAISAGHRRAAAGGAALALAASALWAEAALSHAGVLSSYAGLAPAHTLQTRAEWRGDPAALTMARTAAIAPVRIAPGADSRVTPHEEALIANELARTLCARLSQHLTIVPYRRRADVTVRATITRIRPTNIAAVTASMGTRVVASVVHSPIAPRVPLGLGALSAEAEATDARGVQRAALVWTRVANPLLTRARISHIGDAYQLAAAFANDLSRLVITGRDPLREVTLPVVRRKTSQAACAMYGRGERSGYVNGYFGIAPEATDTGPAPHPASSSHRGTSPR